MTTAQIVTDDLGQLVLRVNRPNSIARLHIDNTTELLDMRDAIDAYLSASNTQQQTPQPTQHSSHRTTRRSAIWQWLTAPAF